MQIAEAPDQTSSPSQGDEGISCFVGICRGLDSFALDNLRNSQLESQDIRDALRNDGSLWWILLCSYAAAVLSRALRIVVCFESWYLIFQGVPGDCGTLKPWLGLAIMLLTAMVFSYMIALPLVIWAGLVGRASLTDLPASCQAGDLLLSFPDVVLSMAFASIVLWVVLALSISAFYWRLRRLVQQDGPSAGDLEAVAAEVLTRPLLEVEPTRECAICLQSDGAEAGGTWRGADGEVLISRGQWRALPCLHAFHESCLLRWLTRSNQCPLCRLNLFEAYGLALTDGEEAADLSF